ncbi:cytochrome P450 704C1-like [Impatiens glandulifera]|uniref:cytochrome P450 704C1-like n=1 Tax=Impatiens glandulifera TaxID=253017 RepID=UPI001FB0F0B4|nr:cytochrome P450 704C1-like [Impatiens glandulifera]
MVYYLYDVFGRRRRNSRRERENKTSQPADGFPESNSDHNINNPTAIILILISSLLIKVFIGKSIRNPKYPPVIGTVFHQLLYFKNLYDRQTEDARKYATFRLLSTGESDPRNVQHILKTNFANYSKGQYNQEITKDLFGEGIFAVDGDKWRQQRKLASFESEETAPNLLQFLIGSLWKTSSFICSTLDSIFKVGFSVELNCMEGTSKEGSTFMKAFDDVNELTYWRYVDPFRKLKRFFNISSEASLKKKVKVINDFVNNLITTKRKHQQNDNPAVSS